MKKEYLKEPLELADVNLAIFSEIDVAILSKDSQQIISAFQKLVQVITPNNAEFQKNAEKYFSKRFILHSELPEEIFHLVLESPLNDNAKKNLFLSPHTNLLFNLALYRPEAFFLKLWEKLAIYKEDRNKLALVPMKQTIFSEISTEDNEIEGVPYHRLGVHFKNENGLRKISGMTFLHILIHEKQNFTLFTNLLLDIIQTEKDNVENLRFSYDENISGIEPYTGDKLTVRSSYSNSLLSLALHNIDKYSAMNLYDQLYSYKIIIDFLLRKIIIRVIYSSFDSCWGAPTGIFERDDDYDDYKKCHEIIENRFAMAELKSCRDIGLLAITRPPANSLSEKILNTLLVFTHNGSEAKTEEEFLKEITTILLTNENRGDFYEKLINYLESHYPLEAFALNPWFQLEQKINNYVKQSANPKKIDAWFNCFYLERKNKGRISKKFIFANSFPKEHLRFPAFFKNQEEEVIYNLINKCINSDTVHFKAYSDHLENHTPAAFIKENIEKDQVYSDALKILKLACNAAENCLSNIATPSNKGIAIAYKFSPVSREFKHQEGSNNARKIIALAQQISESTEIELESLSQKLFMLEKIIQENKDHGGFTSEASLNCNLINEYRKTNTPLPNSTPEMVLENILYDIYDAQKNLATITCRQKFSAS